MEADIYYELVMAQLTEEEAKIRLETSPLKKYQEKHQPPQIIDGGTISNRDQFFKDHPEHKITD